MLVPVVYGAIGAFIVTSHIDAGQAGQNSDSARSVASNARLTRESQGPVRNAFCRPS